MEETAIIKKKLAGERQILKYFRNYQQEDGSLKNIPYWIFTDWVEKKGLDFRHRSGRKDGSSSLMDLQLLWAYELAADLESKFGMQAYATLYNKYIIQLKKTIRNKYWDQKRKLFADRPEKDLFSQHANALAILTGMVDNEVQCNRAEILSDTTLAPGIHLFQILPAYGTDKGRVWK